ncbi:hypothetical protein D3C73_608410 [compost metagenome]
MDHHIHRGQRLDQINGQSFERHLRVDGEEGADGARCGFDIGGRGEVKVEGAFSGFVEFFGIGFVGGGWIGVRRIGRYLEHISVSKNVEPSPSRC